MNLSDWRLHLKVFGGILAIAAISLVLSLLATGFHELLYYYGYAYGKFPAQRLVNAGDVFFPLNHILLGILWLSLDILLFSLFLYLYLHWFQWRPLFQSLGSLLALIFGFFLGILHQIVLFAGNVIFFANRHVYSSPSYTGPIIKGLPRLYAWLLRMHYSKSFSKKPRARRNRRYYLLFVWFFFSFFFRFFFLLPVFFLRALCLWLYSSSNGAFAPFLTLLGSFQGPFYRLSWFLSGPLKQVLAVRLFRFYAALRRLFFYLGVHDVVSTWHSLFEEKNRAAQENLIAYDSYDLSWILAQAAPLTMPQWRPVFLKLYAKIYCLPGNLRLLAWPSLALLWLSSLLALLAKSLLLLLWLPLAFFSELLLRCFSYLGLVRLYWFTFLQSTVLLSLFLRPRWGLLRPFALAWGLLSWLRAPFFPLFPFYLYTLVWLSLQALASLPLLAFHLLRFSLRFIGKRLAFFLLLASLLLFGPHLLSFLCQCIESTLPGLFSAYGVPLWWFQDPPGLYWILLFEEKRSLYRFRLRPRGLRQLHQSQLHWAHVFYYYLWGDEATVDPFKHWLVWEKYLNARTIRGGLTTRRYGREMLCLYGDALGFFPSLGQGRTTKSKLFFLYKLTLLPSRSLQDVDGLYLYQQTHRLLSWATLLVEYPYLFFGRRWDWFVPSFSRALAPLSAHPILGPVFTFYATYYSALGSLALETCASFRALLSPFWSWSWLQQCLALWHLWILRFYEALAWGYESLRRGLAPLSQGQSLDAGWAYFFFLWDLWELQFANERALFAARFFLAPRALSHYLMGLGSCLQGPLEWRSLPDFSPFGFYLCSLAFLEKLADTCSIYWQIPKMRWGLYNLWGEPYLLGYELEDNNPYLRGLHLCRQGFFAGEASFDLAFLLGLLRLEEPYGAEVRPGFPRWKRLVPIIMQGHLFTLRRLLNKPKFYAPWARHLGYLPWALQEPLFPSPFGNRLVDLRLFPSPLLGVAFYFFVLLFLTGFAPSFRKLFFPKVIEGGAEQYWSHFLHDKDLRWTEKLLLPTLSFHPLRRSHDLPLATEDLPWERLPLESFSVLRHSSTVFQEFRMANVARSLSAWWQGFSEARSSSPSVVRRRHRWLLKLWPFPLHPGEEIQSYRRFFGGLYRYHFYDLRFLPMYRELHQVYFTQPRRMDELLGLLPSFDDFNLSAAVVSAYYLMEDEEIRAEYLFRQHLVQSRTSFVNGTKGYLQWLDGRLFDHLLGGLFLHKEGLQGHWISHQASYLMRANLLRFRLTPLLFSKFLNHRTHFFSVQEDTKIYPWVIFWFILFPFLIFLQSLFSFYGWRLDWSPKKARYSSAEYWLLWTEVMLHFDFFSQFHYYIWSQSSWVEHVLRSGSRRSMDDPGQWSNLSQHEEFYVWARMRQWRSERNLFLWKVSPLWRSYFAFSTLSEQRLWRVLVVLPQLLLLLLFVFRCRWAKPRFLVPRFEAVGGPDLSWATLVQKLHYQRMKLQLKKGLLWFWLKA